MSKQDGYSSRTPADLERKYNFGKTFAEVYGLVSDAQKVADEAKEAIDNLDQEAIFNLLTNFGQAQGVYRGDDGNVYINASYIKSGKLAADYIDAENLKVAAANITGELVATQINTKDLKVLAANIIGTLTAGQIDATNLKVSAANITGTLSANQISGGTINGINITGGSLSTAVVDERLGNLTIENSKISFGGAVIERTYDIYNNPALRIRSDAFIYVGDQDGAVRLGTGTGFWVFGSDGIRYYDTQSGYPEYKYSAQLTV